MWALAEGKASDVLGPTPVSAYPEPKATAPLRSISQARVLGEAAGPWEQQLE